MSILWKPTYDWMQIKGGKCLFWSRTAHDGPETSDWKRHYYERPRFALYRWYLRKYKASYYTS